MLRRPDEASIASSRGLSARWRAVCFGMALLAACGRSDLIAANGADEKHPTMAGAGAAFGGASGAASVGGAGSGREVAGASGEGGLVLAGASASGGAAGVDGGAGAPADSIQLNDFEDYQVV